MSSIWTLKTEEDVQVDLEFVQVTGEGKARKEERHPFWIRVRKQLTIGEQRRAMTAGWGGYKTKTGQDTEISINWNIANFSRALAWMTEWSLRDDTGKAIPLKLESLEDLNPAVFEVIDTAINAHVKAVEEKKVAASGGTKPKQT